MFAVTSDQFKGVGGDRRGFGGRRVKRRWVGREEGQGKREL